MAGWITLIPFIYFCPLCLKNGQRVAAASCGISSGGHKKNNKKFFLKKIGKSVTLFKLFSILYMNKKIGKENEKQNAESA